MEPVVIFGAVLVVLCGYLSFVDACRESMSLRRKLAVARQLMRCIRLKLTPNSAVASRVVPCHVSFVGGTPVGNIHEKIGSYMKTHYAYGGFKVRC